MNQAQQPDALRLAEQAETLLQKEASRRNSAFDHYGMGNTPESVDPLMFKMAAELRRLHGRLQCWRLVPVEPTEAQLATVRSQKSHPCAPDRWDSNNRRIYMRMLAAAPTPPGQESQPLTDGEIIAAQEALIEAKDALYRSRIGLQCTHCKKGTYRADGNGYYDFHRCDQCRHVSMWNADGTEFGIQEKPDGPTV